MAVILPGIINAAVRDIQLFDRVVKQPFYNLFMIITRILLVKIVNQSMENINKLIEKDTWNFTRSPGDRHFCYCRHVYFHCYCIFVNTLD